MHADPKDPIHIAIAKDATRADVRIEADADPALVSESMIVLAARERGLDVSGDLRDNARRIAEQYAANPSRVLEGVLLLGLAPRHGEDERLELSPEISGEDAPTPSPDDDDDRAVDHYSRAKRLTVQKGQHIADVVPATPGEEGFNVYGDPIAARDGKSMRITLDPSVELDASGRLIAAQDGLLILTPTRVAVSTALEIIGNVDFATGHVEFDGDVTVTGGVKDCFNVRCAGTLTVHKLVEAADLSARRASLLGGMAARGKGTLNVERDCHARYLDAVRADIGRRLTVEKELVDCHLHVGERLVGERCGIVGGVVHVGGACEIGVLGGADADTTLVLGHLPELESLRERLTTLGPTVEQSLAEAHHHRNQITENAAKLTSSQAERLTELQFELASREQLERKFRTGVERLGALEDAFTDPDLTVYALIHAGSIVCLGGVSLRFKINLRGPLRINLNGAGQVVITDLTCDETIGPEDVAVVERSARAA